MSRSNSRALRMFVVTRYEFVIRKGAQFLQGLGHAAPYPLGRSRPLQAITFRMISDVPPAIVPPTLVM